MSVRPKKPEVDPVAQPQVAAETSARQAADAAEAAARQAADAGKQDAATAATDAELASEASARQAADALKQDAATAATDAELASEASARQAADALAIPLTQKGAASGVAPLGASGQVPSDFVPLGSIRVADVFGHSIPAAGGSKGGDHNGYVDRLLLPLARMRRNVSVGGAIACWPTGGGAGDGGYGWVWNKLSTRWAEAGPYLPLRTLAIPHYGLNDLAWLGGQSLGAFREAMTAIASMLCAATSWPTANNVGWTHGAGMSTVALFTNWTYLGGGVKYCQWSGSSSPGTQFEEFAVPADYEAGQVVTIALSTIAGTVGAGAAITITVTVDGVPTDITLSLDKNGVADAENAKTSGYVLRVGRADQGMGIALASGAHTIRVALKSSNTVGAFFVVDGAWIEADPADGPVLVFPNAHRCVDYSLWNAALHGPNAGVDPMNDASVAAMNVVIGQIAARFPGRSLVVDIDTPLGKNAANFDADKAHPNNRGHGIIADTARTAVLDSGLLTRRRVARAARKSGPAWTLNAEVGRAGVLSNSWTNFGGTSSGFAWWKDEAGVMHMRGAVKGGSAVGATIIQFYDRPLYVLLFKGRNSTGAEQIWQLDQSGNLSVISGGDTTKSELVGEVTWTGDTSQ